MFSYSDSVVCDCNNPGNRNLSVQGKPISPRPRQPEKQHTMHGLTTREAEARQQKFGFNEVKNRQDPEWKKVAWRYLDWVSIVILSAAVVSASIAVNGGRGWTSFVLLIIELNLVVWVGYYSERNAGDAVKELEVRYYPEQSPKVWNPKKP